MSKIKLYGIFGTRSDRIQWALEELNLEYDFLKVNLRKGENKNPEFLKLNPMGQTPCLVHDLKILNESAAILINLAELYSEVAHLIPKNMGNNRMLFWYYFNLAVGSFDKASFQLMLSTKKDSTGKVSIYDEKAFKEFSKTAKILNEKLASQSFIVPCGFTMADIVLFNNLNWNYCYLDKFPHLKRYVHSLKVRPAYKRMREKQGEKPVSNAS